MTPSLTTCNKESNIEDMNKQNKYMRSFTRRYIIKITFSLFNDSIGFLHDVCENLLGHKFAS